MKYLIIVLFLATTAWTKDQKNDSGKDKCIITRAAFDIGSGTTKLKVAKVDRCQKKIIKHLVSRSKPVAYKESLSKGRLGFIEEETFKEGKMILSYFVKEAKAAGAESFTGVATSAFRKARNGESVLERLSKETGTELKVISQEREAELGFLAAVTKTDYKLKDMLVWDIGGGSMQISFYANQKLKVIKSNLASVTFKEEIISKIKGKDISMVRSPNPIGVENYDAIMNLINIDEIKKKLDTKERVVLGIGGVHYYSVKGQVQPKNSYYEASSVLMKAKNKMSLSDKDIGGKYAATEVTNLLLVGGMMQKLSINKVFPIKVNLTDGILIQ